MCYRVDDPKMPIKIPKRSSQKQMLFLGLEIFWVPVELGSRDCKRIVCMNCFLTIARRSYKDSAGARWEATKFLRRLVLEKYWPAVETKLPKGPIYYHQLFLLWEEYFFVGSSCCNLSITSLNTTICHHEPNTTRDAVWYPRSGLLCTELGATLQLLRLSFFQ